MKTLKPVLLALALSSCSFYPSTAQYKPKSASDCPGQKACGYLCVDEDDPGAGCTSDACSPCPEGAANTVPACLGIGTCGLVCATGFVAPDGVPAHGCALAAQTDPANCGSTLHACATGETCTDGLCTVADAFPSVGTSPRGLAVIDTKSVAWATDPSGGLPNGALHRIIGGAAQPDVTGLGHATWVRKEAGGTAIAVETTSPDDDTYLFAYAMDAVSGTSFGTFGGVEPATWVGLAVTSNWLVSAVIPLGTSSTTPSEVMYDSILSGYDGGGSIDFDPVMLEGFGEGAGLLWASHQEGVTRIHVDGPPDDPNNWGFSVIDNGGVPFTGLLAVPHPQRIAARTGSGATGTAEVYFADLTDGSIWVGVAGTATPPRRIVRGDGARSQMDIAADDLGVVWSDLDKGEVWEYLPQSGNPPFLIAQGKPWAVSLYGGRVYFTDVLAQAIRSVAR